VVPLYRTQCGALKIDVLPTKPNVNLMEDEIRSQQWTHGLATLPGMDSRTRIERNRRSLQIALGFIWLIDAVLQYQPYMFTKAFVTVSLQPVAAGNPWIFHRPIVWSDHLMIHHIVLWNALYATIQLLIAIGLFWRPTVRWALGISIVWGIAVWWFAEGFGGIFSGSSPFMGEPGAVILYVLLAALIWPRPAESDNRSVAQSSPLGRFVPETLWAVLWGSFAYYLLIPANRGTQDLYNIVVGMASGEPGWIRSMDSGIATLLNHHGAEFSVVFAVLCVAFAIVILVPSLVRPALVVVLLFSLAVWLVQDFGAMLTSQGTDVNSGPLIALLAWAYWPVARTTRSQVQVKSAQPAIA
jgi:hypothetical protein